MSRAAYLLKLPNSIKNAAQRLAREDGVSLNQWIPSAVAQKVDSVRRLPLTSSNTPGERMGWQ